MIKFVALWLADQLRVFAYILVLAPGFLMIHVRFDGWAESWRMIAWSLLVAFVIFDVRRRILQAQ